MGWLPGSHGMDTPQPAAVEAGPEKPLRSDRTRCSARSGAKPPLELGSFLAEGIDQRGVPDPFGDLQRRRTPIFEFRIIDPVLLHQAHAIDIGAEHRQQRHRHRGLADGRVRPSAEGQQATGRGQILVLKRVAERICAMALPRPLPASSAPGCQLRLARGILAARPWQPKNLGLIASWRLHADV